MIGETRNQCSLTRAAFSKIINNEVDRWLTLPERPDSFSLSDRCPKQMEFASTQQEH